MLASNPVSVDEFRTKLSEFIGRVVYGRDRVIIKKYNKEAAVLLNIDEYKSLIDPTKRLSNGEWKKKFLISDKIRDRISLNDQKKLSVEIDRAVFEVRKKKKPVWSKRLRP